MPFDFNPIAKKYDYLNRLMTCGLDARWRRKAVCLALANNPKHCLDVATGTGDMVREMLKRNPNLHIDAIDLSENMLQIAHSKVPQATFSIASAESLPFENHSFDSVTVAFGVRNFAHLEHCIVEMLRVLRPNGRLVVMELSTPDNAFILRFYHLYTRCIIPWLGKLVAGNMPAYQYLVQSIEHFPKGANFETILRTCGARTIHSFKLFFGVCRIYVATPQSIIQ